MNDDNVEFDFSGHVKNIEDVDNVALDVLKPLTDLDLEQSGLVKTTAFVRSKKSKNALRVKKHKDKKASTGIKQLNIEVPEHHRENIKSLAKDLCSGKNLDQLLFDHCGDTKFKRVLLKLFFNA